MVPPGTRISTLERRNYPPPGWLAFFKGTLIEKRAVSLGDHPGKEFIVEVEHSGQPIKLKVRQYLVQNRYYQITVGIPEDRTFTVEQEAFLQSFALLEE